MQSLTMTIRGIYNFDSTIFNDLETPADIDKETLITHILLNAGNFECLYPDSDEMKIRVKIWSIANKLEWQKLEESRHYEYNPIENYDRYESWTDDNDSKATNNSNAENKVAAYNSENYVNSALGISDNESVSSSNGAHEGHLHGNIGVTTNQQMIREEREIVKFNLYDYILDSFISTFCVMIY